jgi:hypothetical protein
MGHLSTLSRFDLHKYRKFLSTYVLLSQSRSLLNLLTASGFVTETQYVGQCNTLNCTPYSLSGVDEFNEDVMFAGQYHTCCGAGGPNHYPIYGPLCLLGIDACIYRDMLK